MRDGDTRCYGAELRGYFVTYGRFSVGKGILSQHAEGSTFTMKDR